MATFKICVFEHQKREDGKYPVSIRLYWKTQSVYIGTEYYVTDKQVAKKSYRLENGKTKREFKLKDPFIINELNKRITLFEDIKAKKIGYNIELYTAKELAEYLVRETSPGSDGSIDFVFFSRVHCEKLIAKDKKKTAQTLLTTLNAIIDFCNGRQKILITEINAKFLAAFEDYLSGERTIKRLNQNGKMVETKNPGLSDRSIHDYLTSLRMLFYAAMDEYNDEEREEIRIRHNPFRKHKIGKAPESEKRVLTADEICKIRDVKEEKLILKRSILARDVFMLSFYLAGTNLIDLYHLKKEDFKEKRISYQRHKTQDKRKDKAYISILVQPEAMKLMKKYLDPDGEYLFTFPKMYADHLNFVKAVDKGLKHVAKVCEIKSKVSTYYARFSLASIARNDCDISKDDINLLLNHVELNLRVTDIYIKKDWSIIDRAIRKVIDYLNTLKK